MRVVLCSIGRGELDPFPRSARVELRCVAKLRVVENVTSSDTFPHVRIAWMQQFPRFEGGNQNVKHPQNISLAYLLEFVENVEQSRGHGRAFFLPDIVV